MTLEQRPKPAVGFSSDTKERKTYEDPQIQRAKTDTGNRHGHGLSPLHSCEATTWAFQNAVKQARHRPGVVSEERLLPSLCFPTGSLRRDLSHPLPPCSFLLRQRQCPTCMSNSCALFYLTHTVDLACFLFSSKVLLLSSGCCGTHRVAQASP